jgi:hypothetical protein
MANLEITGKIVQIDEPVKGQSSKGEWKKQQFIIETEDQYPKKICFINWNDKVSLSNLKPGTKVNISFNAESREYNGRWYTDLKVWKMDIESGNISNTPPPPTHMNADDVPPPNYEELDEGDLPF